MSACNRYLIDPYSLYNRNQLMKMLGCSRDSINNLVQSIDFIMDGEMQTYKGIDILMKLYPSDEQIITLALCIKNETTTQIEIKGI